MLIREDMVDHNFIDTWCEGFDDLAAAMEEWTPKKASEICGVDAALIEEAAKYIGTHTPVTLQWGVACDMQASATPLCYALLDIIGLTGSVDVPGGFIVMPGHAFGIGLEPWLVPEALETMAEQVGHAVALDERGELLLEALAAMVETGSRGEPIMEATGKADAEVAPVQWLWHDNVHHQEASWEA